MKAYYIYILTNKKNGVLYTGFTDDIQRRLQEHKNREHKGFSYQYNTDKLVYYETALTAEEAMLREKRIKKWNRSWKISLIEKFNPGWEDLSKNFEKSLSEREKLDLLFRKNK